ncbi:MAG: ATP phosphoribosyltransferase regulatory subunit, partial [Desulfobacterales bacterium]|nr:ATP phosphoribosyltransferase regulatory subunit [Desulfobacterales bacterium]
GLRGIDEIYEDLRYLDGIMGELGGLWDLENIRIDLSELGSQSYHSGMVFQGYTPGIDAAFLSGGRYDKLLDSFGFDAPSAGFSILLRKIEEQLAPPVKHRPIQAEGESFKERLNFARELRRKGKTVIL